ncbi:MAG: 8-oxo-dGTP diphosphatase [Bacilli bacterium]|nr:8-oxo-dGTP diphosphatase [Bacilli bacterium]
MKKTKETVLAYLVKEDSCLMLLRNKKKHDINANKWIGVGGHLEEKESPLDALYREIKEETGLDVISYEYKSLIRFNYDDISELMHLYIVNEFKGDLIDCDEGTLKWIKKSDLFSLELWEGDKIFLKKLINNEPYFELELNYLEDKLISFKFIK